jgi:hypothetical protein
VTDDSPRAELGEFIAFDAKDPEIQGLLGHWVTVTVAGASEIRAGRLGADGWIEWLGGGAWPLDRTDAIRHMPLLCQRTESARAANPAANHRWY